MSEYECLRKDSCPIRLDVEKQLEEGGTISQSGPLMAIRTGKSVTLQQKFSTGGVKRTGGTKFIPVDIRVIAAMNRNLEEMVKKRNSEKTCIIISSPAT